MNESILRSGHVPDINAPLYDPQKLEATPLEDLLNFMIKLLAAEMQTIRSYLEPEREVDEYVRQVLDMIDAMEHVKAHFEFVLAGLACKSTEEFQMLKDRYASIKGYYEGVDKKEDFTAIPAKYVIALLHDKGILEYRRIMKNCFKKDCSGEMTFLKKKENLARLKIITGRFKVVQDHFRLVIVFPKDDIFCLEKSSPVWQDLYKSTIFKEIVTKQEVEESSHRFNFLLYFSHLIIRNRIRNKTLHNPKAVFSLCGDVIYYGIRHAKVETQALLYLLNPNVEDVFRAWNLAEKRWVLKFHLAHIPHVAYDELIHVPRLFPAITPEVILKEYKENTFNKLAPMDPSQFQDIKLPDTASHMRNEVFIERPNTIPVRILADENLHIQKSQPILIKKVKQKAKAIIKGSDSNVLQNTLDEQQAIIVHIHGGGFVATSSATHKVYLAKWVRSLKLIHFSIDYRLAPQHKYPAALDDVWQAYLWITNFASRVLGIKHQKIILVGDSAGGNLALALMLRLVRAGLKPPQGCLLIYPALYVDANSYSPSYYESLDDPMLPYPILKLVVKAYVPEGFRNLEDPFISPVLASDELLEKLPPLRIVTGSKDPLHDDTWRFLAKLKKLNKNVKMIVHSHLSHGFLCHKELKNHDLFAEEACELIRDLIDIDATE